MTGTTTDATREAAELRIEESAAWFEYLEATRGLPPVKYVDVEGWAWERLVSRLAAVASRQPGADDDGA